MHLTDTATATADHQFTDGNTISGPMATEVDAPWLNAVQNEIANVILGAGIALAKGDHTQLRQAILELIAANIPTLNFDVVRQYTRQQSHAPVYRVNVSGSQAVDCDIHALLSIIANGSLNFPDPTHLQVGDCVRLLLYSAAPQNLTWGAAYLPSGANPLPTTTLAGKWMILDFFCHKAGSVILLGVGEEG